jgi:hypothetical protein
LLVLFVSLFAAEREGFGLGSRLAVARLGLATTSRFRLLAKQRSGVLIPTRAKQFARSSSSLISFAAVFFERSSNIF